MPTKLISAHEIRVYELLKNSGRWMTAAEIAAQANVAPRTARAHAHRLSDAGVFEEMASFPSYRYRLNSSPNKAAQKLIAAIVGAAQSA